jgi:4-diphosphocytidyl-2-C-methyl-D-erythritol kinase
VGKRLVNDLEAGCLGLRPELAPLLQRLKRVGAAGVLMSGSGSTCFAVFSSAAALDRGQRRFQPRPGETVFTTRTLLGPTRGAWSPKRGKLRSMFRNSFKEAF